MLSVADHKILVQKKQKEDDDKWFLNAVKICGDASKDGKKPPILVELPNSTEDRLVRLSEYLSSHDWAIEEADNPKSFLFYLRYKE